MKQYLTVLTALGMGTVYAGEIGPLQSTQQAGDWDVGVHYFWDFSEWSTGSDIGDDIIGELTNEGVYGTVRVGLTDRIEAFAQLGGAKFRTEPEFNASDLESSLDGFYAAGLSGVLYQNDWVKVGPFVEYTRYGKQYLSGDVDGSGFELDAHTWEELTGGLLLQHELPRAKIYYGAYHTDQSIELSGTASGLTDHTIKEDGHLGFVAGLLHPVTDEVALSLEFNQTSDWGVAIGVNYNPQPAAAKVVTKTQVKYVESPKPTGPAEKEFYIHFQQGSSEVAKSDWVKIREFGEFLQTYENSEGQIEGHCDCVGPEDANMILSQKRAESVKLILTDLFGIAPERLTIIPMGESAPFVEPDQAHGRPENRRVVLKAIAR